MITTTTAATTTTTKDKRKYDPTDMATNISELVIEHAGVECSHCTKILKQVMMILEANKK